MLKRSYRLRRLAFAWTLLLLINVCPIAFAQSTATFQGTVTDPSAAIVVTAKVTVHNQGTGIERTTQTDTSGNYQVAALPVGSYRIEVRAQGFQTAVVNSIQLEVSQTAVQNIPLTIGGASESVSVTS